MKKTALLILLFILQFYYSQVQKHDTLKTAEIKTVTVIAKKPTVQTKIDRTIFNVAESSILAGNTSWDILRMTPLVSIDNNDAIKAEGESVVVYINDRKSVFTGKELKEYLKTIPAEKLSKIEVITNPSSRYETSGAVVNIVLKKPDNEGLKGSATFTNSQSSKNNQYTNLNLNYHKNKFTQTLTGSYGDNTSVSKSMMENFLYANQSLTKINTESISFFKAPSFSSTSEIELNDKNTTGLIIEYGQYKNKSEADTSAEEFLYGNPFSSYIQKQNSVGTSRNLGNNAFYKYYDEKKNKTLEVNLGFNYESETGNNQFVKNTINTPIPTGIRYSSNNQNREYYLKIDYSQPLGKEENQLEVGGKMNFRNNIAPIDYFNLLSGNWMNDNSKSNRFHYIDNLNFLYTNYSQKFFKKLETRIGLRYEYTSYHLKQDVGQIEKTNQYGNLLPNILLKYSFNDNYNLTANYSRYAYMPWFTEFNPFLLPTDNGNYSRGNMDLLPTKGDRINLKLGLYKKYFISISQSITYQDYWYNYILENGKLVNMPFNFEGKQKRYALSFNTNQTFLKNKFSVNFQGSLYYNDNSDFIEKNQLDMKKYITNYYASANLSYTNLLDKNININAWAGYFSQDSGNVLGNKRNLFHTLSVTKIFNDTGMEVSLQLNNIFSKPNYDVTSFSPIGTFRTSEVWDWYGASLTLVKRFGNQKVKENTKTDVEKESGGKKESKNG